MPFLPRVPRGVFFCPPCRRLGVYTERFSVETSALDSYAVLYYNNEKRGFDMRLEEFTEQDFKALYDWMCPLWEKTYGEIISRQQIVFLLEQYFSPRGIAHYRQEGYRYFRVEDGGTKGVVVFVDRGDETYLDKLYLLPEERGKGYAAFVFDELKKRGKDVTLNVNRSNARAVACYLKNGFQIEREEEIVLSDGMVNLDYRMRLPVCNS